VYRYRASPEGEKAGLIDAVDAPGMASPIPELQAANTDAQDGDGGEVTYL